MSEDKIEQVINGLGPLSPVEGDHETWTLADRMAHYTIPGLSIAVIDGGRLAWSHNVGIADRSTDQPLGPDALFQACSMSKPLAALAVMQAVERGRLDLDRPVNDYLKSWQLPDGPFDAEAVTLRRILSHTAGLSTSGFGGYRRDEPIPSLPQVLDGSPPANSEAVRVEVAPGSRELYSGGGTTIAQMVLEDLYGQPFAMLMKERVLDPLAMVDSTFDQPPPESWLSRCVAGHDEDGQRVEGGFHVFPERAAAGLWTTASDYARFLMGLQAALDGASGAIVSQKTATYMTTRQPRSHFGLGPQLAGHGPTKRFGHSGGNFGFRCDSKAYVTGDYGAVVLTNGNGRDNGGWTLAQEVFASIARVYDWPGFLRPPRSLYAMTPGQLRAYTGRFMTDDGGEIDIWEEEGRLISRAAPMAPIELLPVSQTDFFSKNSMFDIRFVFGDNGGVAQVTVLDRDAVVISATRADN